MKTNYIIDTVHEISRDRCIGSSGCIDKRLIPTFVNVSRMLTKLLECKALANPQLPGTFVA